MSAEIERLDTLRREFLQLLYEASGGSTTGGIQMLEIGSQLGLDDDECLQIVQWLVDRGRVRWFSMGGNISITPTGVDVAEAAHREVGRPSARSVAAQPSATTGPAAATGDAYDFDVFVSHASEDKDRFARPLFLELQGRGLRVWFDEAELRVGDSLTQKINDGLSRSRFGVVILSPAFFAKNWPQAELAGLANRHISSGEVVVLPVWLDITEAVLRQRAPLLTDLLALQASAGVTHVASGIEERVRGTSSRPQTVTRAVADAGRLDPMTVKGRFFPWGWSAVVGNDERALVSRAVLAARVQTSPEPFLATAELQAFEEAVARSSLEKLLLGLTDGGRRALTASPWQHVEPTTSFISALSRAAMPREMYPEFSVEGRATVSLRPSPGAGSDPLILTLDVAIRPPGEGVPHSGGTPLSLDDFFDLLYVPVSAALDEVAPPLVSLLDDGEPELLGAGCLLVPYRGGLNDYVRLGNHAARRVAGATDPQAIDWAASNLTELQPPGARVATMRRLLKMFFSDGGYIGYEKDVDRLSPSQHTQRL